MAWWTRRTAVASLNSLWGGTLLQVLAMSFLMLLILVPYIAFREVAGALGPKQLKALLLNPRPPPGHPK